jgi:hypothetical protein
VDYHEAAYIVAAKLLGITLRPTRLDRLRKCAADGSAGRSRGGYEPEADWIAGHFEDNRNGGGRRACCEGRGCAGRGDHGYLTTPLPIDDRFGPPPQRYLIVTSRPSTAASALRQTRPALRRRCEWRDR